MPTSTKSEIHDRIVRDASYREDMTFIADTLNAKDVFVGEVRSFGEDDREVQHCITVGMYQHDLPELVFAGIPSDLVRKVVSDLREEHDFDREFLAGRRTKVILGLSAMAIPIEAPSQQRVLKFCADYYTLHDKGELKAAQVVISDEEGRFPWDQGYSEQDRRCQPLMGMSLGASAVN